MLKHYLAWVDLIHVLAWSKAVHVLAWGKAVHVSAWIAKDWKEPKVKGKGK